jgi:diphthamide synthase (EF-2-diphthine--ammonia ligase)
MHGIRREVLLAQARAARLPLEEVAIHVGGGDEAYSAAMAAGLGRLRALWPALGTVAFGDLFLEDVRAWREERLARAGWAGRFPLWGRDTAALAAEVWALGFRATVCCVDTTQLDLSFAGRAYGPDLVAALPAGADPCAERGEFHTCVWDGPIFTAPLRLDHGETVLRDARFAFTDLLLHETAP